MLQHHTMSLAPRSLRAARTCHQLRCLATAPNPTPPRSKPRKNLSPVPLPSPQPIFPAPNNPFHPQPAPQPKEYSETTKTLVRGVAKLMGYNSRASTTIRETGRMMKGIVEAVDRDHAFWYDQCRLPPTYQTFFQLHLLYILILLPRLRSLPAHTTVTSPVPEPAAPSAPSNTPDSQPISILTKANYEAYPGELLDHFFELAESQMRIVLGQGERERVIQKYMAEMAEQWKGAGAGLDYVLGLSLSENPADNARADEELASWVWRNLFQGKGLTATPLPGTTAESSDVDLAEKVERVVRFVRREFSRLDRIPDGDVLGGNIGAWGSP